MSVDRTGIISRQAVSIQACVELSIECLVIAKTRVILVWAERKLQSIVKATRLSS